MCPRRVLLVAICLAVLVPPAWRGMAQDSGHVLISEVLYDPAHGGMSTAYQWIELFNPTDQEAILEGWTLRDNHGQDSMPSSTISPGHYLVVAATALGFAESNPDFADTFVVLDDGSVGDGLGHSGDRVAVFDGDGDEVDAMSYGVDGSIFDPPCPPALEGRSLARVPSGFDTGTFAEWYVQLAPNPGALGVASPATPTPTNTVVPTPSSARPGAVVIDEIMQHPAAVSDTAGEWFEVLNTTGSDVDLNGWTIRDEGRDLHRIEPGKPLWLPAHGYLVLGRDADIRTNGGVAVDYQYSGVTLSNEADEIILLDGAGQEIDRVAYDAGRTFPNPAGASMALLAPDRDNSYGASWRASFRTWPGSAGDLGSPGAANPTPSIGEIQGSVFEDSNANGRRDAGEPGIPGVLIGLSTGPTFRTAASGWYAFYNLPAALYGVTEVQPAGYESTTPDHLSITIAPAEVSLGHDFGDRRLPPSPTPSASPTSEPTEVIAPRLLLSEVLYDAPQSGADWQYEWVEVVNAAAVPVNLAGWTLGDNASQDTIPAFLLGPSEYLVIAGTAAGFNANHPDFDGNLVTLESPIGNGLGNSGDRVVLVAPDSHPADEMSYGDDAGAFSPSCPSVEAGQSLARVPSWVDTNTAGDWVRQLIANPGIPGFELPPTPTATTTITPGPSFTPSVTATRTPTHTPRATPSPSLTPSVTPTSTPIIYDAGSIRLNEILPYPSHFDWDGDGTVDAEDEWVEVYSRGSVPVDLGGWSLDDVAAGGGRPYVIPGATWLAPGAFRLFFRSQTQIAYNNDGDTVRLLGPDAVVVDSFAYEGAGPDRSFSRTEDGDGAWTEDYPPSPGRSNVPPTPSPTR